jgi:hypothetical protein
MGRFATRSAFAAALCTGVAMVGTAVYGLVGVDAELQRSAVAAQERVIREYDLRVVEPHGNDCPAAPTSKQRV